MTTLLEWSRELGLAHYKPIYNSVGVQLTTEDSIKLIQDDARADLLNQLATSETIIATLREEINHHNNFLEEITRNLKTKESPPSTLPPSL